MAQNLIDKRSHRIVHQLLEARDRKNAAMVFCEGEKLIDECIRSRWPIRALCYSAKSKAKSEKLFSNINPAVPRYVLDDKVMRFVSDLETPPGLVALADIPKQDLRAVPSASLVLHGLQLPQNVGALLRTAEAAGLTRIYLTKNSADVYNPKCLRGSSGSVFRLEIQQGIVFHDLMAHFKEIGIHTIAADQSGLRNYDETDWNRPFSLVLGSEGGGFQRTELSEIEETVRIPMEGKVESLNVGVAAAVCLFEAARQRRGRKIK